MEVLKILILPICECRISFRLCHLECFSSMSYSFQCTDFSSFCLNLFLGILLFFDAIFLVNGIVLLISH